jgi:hypothetical protein
MSQSYESVKRSKKTVVDNARKKQDCGMNLIIIYPQNCVSNYVYCVSSSMCETKITQEGHAAFAVVKNWLHPHTPPPR